MSASGAYDDRAAVGRRIGQARRELGLTQGELATRIGVPLGILDRYETGRADPSGKLAQIAEVTSRQVAWFTSAAQHGVGGDGHEAELPAELGRRIAESIGQRGSAGQELAERIAAPLGEYSSALETGDPSVRMDAEPDLAETSRDREERTALMRREKELQATLAEEQRKVGEAIAEGARLAEELERVNAKQLAFAEALEQSRSELADSRTQQDELAQWASERETEMRLAEERAAEATNRLDGAETELERLRKQERSLAEELDRRQAELSIRSAQLDTRETAVADAETSIEDRRRALDDLELHAAAVERLEEAARLRESELERVTADRQALAGMLEQSRSELANSRLREVRVTRRVSQFETELRAAEERAAKAADRLDQAEKELERRREHERSVAEELDLRQAELSIRSAQLDTRETAVGAATETSIEDRRRALDDLELRAAAMERREEAVHLRESELERRARLLTELVGRLDELRDTSGSGGSQSPRPEREDEHIAIVSGHGYRLVARYGAVPKPGELVELDDGEYLCVRISGSPFLGDDRRCAVLEPLPASEP